MNSKLPAALSVVPLFRENFERDDEFDRTERDELAGAIREQQVYTAEEETMINNVNAKLGALEWKNFEELESPDHLVKMGKIFIEGGGGVGRASVTVDASCEECAAWEMTAMSRERVRTAASLERSLTSINGHHGVVRVVYDFGIPGFLPREFLAAQVWRRQGNKLTVVYDDVEHADFPLNPSLVRGTTTAHYEYEKLQEVGGLPQTSLTYTQQISLGGIVPKFVVNGQAVNQLVYLSAMRKRFDKSLEIDNGSKRLDMAMISNSDDEYSEAENSIVEDGKKLFAEFEGMKAKHLKMKSSLTRAKLAFKDGDRHAWGWATTSVRTSPSEALAYLWNTHRKNAQRKNDLEKNVEERPNDHNVLMYRKRKTPSAIADRDVLYRIIWRKESYGNFLLVTSPEESAKRPVTSCAVRARYPIAIRIKRKTAAETTIEQLSRPDLGGTIPAWVMTAGMSGEMARVTQVQEFFQESRGVAEWDEDDGRAVGEVMCIKTKAERYREKGESKVGARMRALFKKQKGLKQVAEKYVRERSEPISFSSTSHLQALVIKKFWTSGVCHR